MRPPRGNKVRTIEGEDEVLEAFRRKVGHPDGAKKLAEASGISRAFISQVRNGEARITPRLAEALGFRLKYERIEQ